MTRGLNVGGERRLLAMSPGRTGFGAAAFLWAATLAGGCFAQTGDGAGTALRPSAGTAADAVRDLAPAAHDMSALAMFLGADIVVKGVIVGLAFASLVTWTILLAKTFEFTRARRRIEQALGTLCRCKTLADAEAAFPSGHRDVVSNLVAETTDEANLSAGVGPDGGVHDRATARCTEVIRAEGRRLRIGTGLLATIGSTAPFVGLFGTVWGIMNSFVGIAKAQTTNLAVVAPGIAEALLATAIGLVAAIPAVIIYNHFARVTKNHLERVSRASGIVLRLLSRDLDVAGPAEFRLAAE